MKEQENNIVDTKETGNAELDNEQVGDKIVGGKLGEYSLPIHPGERMDFEPGSYSGRAHIRI